MKRPELPAEFADAALPLLLYAESCPRCRFLARLVRFASLGAIRLEPMEREVWRRFYHEDHPETRGHPVLFRQDGRTVWGPPVFLVIPALVIRTWAARAWTRGTAL